MAESKVFNADCMEIMKQYPDKYFELAIVDPPYGIGDFQQSDANYEPVKWNGSIADKEYFLELQRISKNQIIWGANYYNCFPKNGGAIIWDKMNAHPSISRCEIASCSLQKRVTHFIYEWHGYKVKQIDPGAFHPCQKPVALYRWLLKNYAKAGDKILDTHLGSGSSRIAAHEMGFDFTGVELDESYFLAQEARFNKYLSQINCFHSDYDNVERQQEERHLFDND